MKLVTSLLAVAFAATESQAQSHNDGPVVSRDLATLQTVIKSVGDSLTKLDTTVQAFNGQDFTSLGNDAFALNNAIKMGTTQIQGTAPISADEAVQLQPVLTPLQNTGKSLAQHLVDKRPQIQAASLCGVVRSQTMELGTGSKDLIAATIMKVPQQLQTVASQLTGQFTSTLDGVQQSFAQGNCTDGGASLTGAASNGTTSAGSGGGSSSGGNEPKKGGAAELGMCGGISGVLGIVAATGFVVQW